jgi:hypothetical protein
MMRRLGRRQEGRRAAEHRNHLASNLEAAIIVDPPLRSDDAVAGEHRSGLDPLVRLQGIAEHRHVAAIGEAAPADPEIDAAGDQPSRSNPEALRVAARVARRRQTDLLEAASDVELGQSVAASAGLASLEQIVGEDGHVALERRRIDLDERACARHRPSRFLGRARRSGEKQKGSDGQAHGVAWHGGGSRRNAWLHPPAERGRRPRIRALPIVPFPRRGDPAHRRPEPGPGLFD